MFDETDIGLYAGGAGLNPARQTIVGFGYDPESYIATAGLVPSSYVTQAAIEAKIGGNAKLIESVDDSSPPFGALVDGALAVYQAIIQNVVTEINGYLSSIYPIPLAQTGTVAVLQVTTISADGLGTVTGIKMVENGNYQTAPVSAQSPKYLRYLDPLANVSFWGQNWQLCQTGTGLALTVSYAAANYSDESGQLLQAQTVNGTPAIATNGGGTGYNVGDILVLVGGSSFVPAKIREACLVLICHSLYQRRLAPDEKNPFATLAKFWREFFAEIGEGDKQLDGTYKRFFSAGASWNQESVLFGANSL